MSENYMIIINQKSHFNRQVYIIHQEKKKRHVYHNVQNYQIIYPLQGV